ncbi:MAG: type II secretion system F family protein [Planctomycetota bacterium]
MQTLILIAAFWLFLGMAIMLLLRLDSRRRRVRFRLSEFAGDMSESRDRGRTWYAWWLYRAGYRSGRAPFVFGLILFCFAAAAASIVWLIFQTGLMPQAERLLYEVPGGVGEVFLPLAWIAPWMGGLSFLAMPILIIRARRRKRIMQTEQDLPVTLDLLATLAESGIGFDAALDRILDTQSSIRPLPQDMRMFQVDILAGRSRIEALRRLMARVDVPWFTIFVSALIHAEQVGSGLANTLRIQADDLRNRRRERVLALTMSLPVKLVLPLVICFLPGILLAAIGPTAYQVLTVLDSSSLQQGAGFQP